MACGAACLCVPHADRARIAPRSVIQCTASVTLGARFLDFAPLRYAEPALSAVEWARNDRGSRASGGWASYSQHRQLPTTLHRTPRVCQEFWNLAPCAMPRRWLGAGPPPARAPRSNIPAFQHSIRGSSACAGAPSQHSSIPTFQHSIRGSSACAGPTRGPGRCRCGRLGRDRLPGGSGRRGGRGSRAGCAVFRRRAKGGWRRARRLWPR